MVDCRPWTPQRSAALRAAARNLFGKRNLASLKAVWDDRQWIDKV
jgi:hypothetical protein